MVTSKYTIIETQDLVNIFRAISPPNGWVKRAELIVGIINYIKCSPPTANKVLKVNTELFIKDERMFKLREDLVPIECVDNPEVYDKSHKFLDKIALFLSTKIGVEDFLIKLSTIRSELMDGVFFDLDQMLIMLENKFGEEVEYLIKEGKTIRDASTSWPENSISSETEENIGEEIEYLPDFYESEEESPEY